MSDNNKDRDFAPINLEVSDRIPLASGRNSASTISSQSSNGGSNKLNIMVLLLAMLALGGCAYLYMLHTNDLEVLAANEKRIEALEGQLSATGEEMGNSTVALQVKLGEIAERTDQLWEQMDKLWASAWRRNQQEISSLESKVNNLQQDANKLIKELDTKVAQTTTNTSNVQSRVDSVNAKVNSQANELLALSVRQDANDESAGQHNASMRSMAEKLILLEKRNTALLQQIQQLEKKFEALANKSV